MRKRSGLGMGMGVLALAAVASVVGAALGRQQFTLDRNRMVDEEIVGAGIKDSRVIQAMRDTPRHEFVSVSQRKDAYFDMALPIGESQTISPPFVVAFMTEQLDPQPTDNVLEIGTGSGYQAAVLSPLVENVYTIEIVKPLGERAAKTLKRLKYDNVHCRIGDGYQGWPEHAPFDKIIVTCSPENVPQLLVDQLREGGRMVIPLGERYQQTMYLFRKENGKLVSEALRPTLFVPMTGEAEENRVVQPDPLHPTIENGSFEDLATEGDVGYPIGWHYVRQMKTITADDAPDGKSFVEFSNMQPGRGSQAVQAFPIDGRQVRKLDVALQVRAKEVRRGQSGRQLPTLVITFYDERREIAGKASVGPWQGTFDWQLEQTTVNVPIRAREAIVHVGLLGAVGELAIDSIHVGAAKPR